MCAPRLEERSLLQVVLGPRSWKTRVHHKKLFPQRWGRCEKTISLGGAWRDFRVPLAADGRLKRFKAYSKGCALAKPVIFAKRQLMGIASLHPSYAPRSRHAPRMRGIQYAAALRSRRKHPGVLDRPRSRTMTVSRMSIASLRPSYARAAVMPRASGASSTRRRLDLVANAAAYWIVRRSLSSGRPEAGPVGGR
jgi:hypothetical protein